MKLRFPLFLAGCLIVSPTHASYAADDSHGPLLSDAVLRGEDVSFYEVRGAVGGDLGANNSVRGSDNRASGHMHEAKTSSGAVSSEKVTTISPLFGQLVKFSIPAGFTDVFEDADKDAYYIREAVLAGESTGQWSQMVTLTANEGLGLNPNVTPHAFANRFAEGFKRACPTSFGATSLGDFKLSSHDAFASVISCGTVNARSESALLIVIKGSNAYYTIQWAERGSAAASPIKFDEAKWTERFKTLMPIRLCPIIQGEPAPYASCING